MMTIMMIMKRVIINDKALENMNQTEKLQNSSAKEQLQTIRKLSLHSPYFLLYFFRTVMFLRNILFSIKINRYMKKKNINVLSFPKYINVLHTMVSCTYSKIQMFSSREKKKSHSLNQTSQ